MTDLRPLDRTSPLPLWAQLADELRRRLREGELDGRLPPEPRLAEGYGVSRQTVREAVRRLREAGLLTAERGRGTFVRVPDPDPPAADVPPGPGRLLAALETARPGQVVRVRALDRTSEPRAAARLGMAAGAGLVHLERLWSLDGQPIALDRAWVPGAEGEGLLDADFRSISLHDALRRWCELEVDAGSERIGLSVPAGEPRRLLALEKRQPALLIERLGRSGGRPVEWGETLLRADRVGLALEWSGGRRSTAVVVGEPGGGPPVT